MTRSDENLLRLPASARAEVLVRTDGGSFVSE